MNTQIASIIVTYNRKDILEKSIDCIMKQEGIACDIIVIDNASTDGTGELFKEPKSNLYYFNTGSNIGGAGGFNFGIRKAVEMGYEYLYILDDDTLPTQNALKELMDTANILKDDFGFLSSKVLWKNQSICEMNIQKETKWKRLKEFNKIKKIQYASFVSLLVKTETVKKVGLPYKEFFIWADDWEYTRRISKFRDSYYVPQSIVHHFCQSNIGADIVNAPTERIDRFKYMYRNDVVMYRQDGLEGSIYLLIRNIAHIIKIILQSDNKLNKIGILVNSSRMGHEFYPEIEYIR